MEGDAFDEPTFFDAIAKSGARVLLIGRRALVALGAPLLTADYDLWLHFDDIEKLNGALAALDFEPNYSPVEARARGRYVLESSEHVDVMVARSKATKDGVTLSFDDAWKRSVTAALGGRSVRLPTIDDLIATKRWAMREKDLADITYLETLKKEGA